MHSRIGSVNSGNPKSGHSLDGSGQRVQTVPMETLGKRLRAARDKAGMSAAAASRALGFKASNVVTRWEIGDNRPDPEDVARLAVLYGVPVGELMGAEGAKGAEHPRFAEPTRLVPLYAGPVPAGVPLYSGGEQIGEESTTHPRADWAVRVAGDSMIGAGIEEGDVVACRKVESQDEVRNGDIVVALVRGDVTVKRLMKMPSGSCLLRADPARPQYPDIPCGEDVLLQGVVVEMHHRPGRLVPPQAAPSSAPHPMATAEGEWRRILNQLSHALEVQAEANLQHGKAVADSAQATREAVEALVARRTRRTRRSTD